MKRTFWVLGILPILLLSTLSFAQTISLDYVETDIRSVCADIVIQLKEKGVDVDIVLGPNVEAPVTLGPVDLSLEKTLDMVCASGGFRYIRMEDYYVIMVADPDNPIFQRYAERDVVYLDYAGARDILGLLKSYQPYLQTGGGDASIMVMALPGEMMQEIKQAVRALDVKKKQIEIQLFASEVSEKSFREFGLGSLEGTWGDGLEETGKVYGIDIGPVTFGASYRNDSIIALNLRALYERGEAKITGSPKIRVLEGHEAYIRLGEERHILSLLEREAGLYYAYTEKEEVTAESGLTTKVDRVTSNDEIVFEFVQTNLEEILESVQQTRSGEIIRVNKREARTSLILTNYETIRIGSMTVEREKTLKRFPPYTSGEKELVRLDLYMTANVVGTPPPPEYKGLEKFMEGFSMEAPKQKGFFARHPFLTLLVIGGIVAAASQ